MKLDPTDSVGRILTHLNFSREERSLASTLLALGAPKSLGYFDLSLGAQDGQSLAHADLKKLDKALSIPQGAGKRVN